MVVTFPIVQVECSAQTKISLGLPADRLGVAGRVVASETNFTTGTTLVTVQLAADDKEKAA